MMGFSGLTLLSQGDAVQKIARQATSLTYLGEDGVVSKGNGIMSVAEKGRSSLSLLSRVAVACCALPATFVFYRTPLDWLRALAGGKRLFAAVCNRPNLVYARLATTPRLVAASVLVPLGMALQIRRSGGIAACAVAAVDVIRREGLSGIRRRVSRWVPVSSRRIARALAANRILVMDYRIPMADVSAGERATVGILRDLRGLGFDVVFLPGDMRPSVKYAAVLQQLGVTVITSADGYGTALDYLFECGSGFSAFYLFRIEVALPVLDTIRAIAPEARIIFHAPDLYHLREGREAELKDDQMLRARTLETKQRELAVIQQADHTVLISHSELEILSREIPDARLSVFHGLYAPVVVDTPPFGSRKDVFFLGGFAHTPNVDAVCWFTDAIWPLILESLPDVTFHIIGSEVPPQVRALAGHRRVNVVGFVEDLEPLMASMRLGVAPLRYGAGIKGKVAMTLGAGVPCVCTTVAAEGMYLDGDMLAYISDDPSEFARSVVKLYSNEQEWQHIAGHGKEIVGRHFSEQANQVAFKRVLTDAGVVPPAAKSRGTWRSR